MNTQIFIRLCPGFSLSRMDGFDNQLEWCWLDSSGGIKGKVLFGTLVQLEGWYADQSPQDRELPVTLIVSGNLCSCYRKDLLEGQRKHWQQALPYLLEEQLATDVDNVHIAAVADSSGESINAGWISHHHMEQLLTHFANIGIELQHVLPEAQFFEGVTGLVSVWLEGTTSYIAAPGNYGQLVDSAALEVLVPSILKDDGPIQDELIVSLDEDEEEETPDMATMAAGIRIFYIHQSASLADELAGMAGVSAEREQLKHESLLFEMLPYLVARYEAHQLIDFRSGIFKSSSKSSKLWRQWRPVVILTGIWLVIEILINVGGGFYYKHKAEQLMEENLATYRELRPSDKRTVDVKHGLTLFLKNATSANTSPAFLLALQKVSAASVNDVDIAVWSMDFNEAGGRLILDIRAKSFEALNRYVEVLKTKGLGVNIENGNQDNMGVTARVIVRNA